MTVTLSLGTVLWFAVSLPCKCILEMYVCSHLELSLYDTYWFCLFYLCIQLFHPLDHIGTGWLWYPSLLLKWGLSNLLWHLWWNDVICGSASFSDSQFCSSYLSALEERLSSALGPGDCVPGCLFLVLSLMVTSPSLSFRPNFQICNRFLLQMVILWLHMRNSSGCLASVTVTSSCTWGQQGNGIAPAVSLNEDIGTDKCQHNVSLPSLVVRAAFISGGPSYLTGSLPFFFFLRFASHQTSEPLRRSTFSHTCIFQHLTLQLSELFTLAYSYTTEFLLSVLISISQAWHLYGFPTWEHLSVVIL